MTETSREFIPAEQAIEIINALANPRDVEKLREFLNACRLPENVLHNSAIKLNIQALIADLVEPFGGTEPDQETKELVQFFIRTFSIEVH